MNNPHLDWTHKSIRITDIRKFNKLYLIKINDPNALEFKRNLDPNDLDKSIEKTPSSALFVKDIIFEERLKSYFLKDVSQISRADILSVFWNMYLTKGYYIKINERGEVEQFNHDPEKWYVSYLEIDGDLGTFSSVYKELKDASSPVTNQHPKVVRYI